MVLRLVAMVLVALAPMLYFVAGASDDATESDGVGLAAVLMLLAWPPLALSLGVARRGGRRLVASAIARSLVLLLSAGAMLALARHLGIHRTIYGDGAWALYWVLCAAAWLALSHRLAGRRR
jgi:C4-dicarboxylate transporter